MANMFSGNIKKRVPKNFKECYTTDPVSENLWSWSERLERWGALICFIMVIVGIVEILTNAIEASNLLDELNIRTDDLRRASIEYGVELKTPVEEAMDTMILWVFYCFLEYCAYHVIALLVGSLASIVQHNKITANIALYNAAKGESDFFDDEEEDISAEESAIEDTSSEITVSNTGLDENDDTPKGKVKTIDIIIYAAIVVLFLIMIVVFASEQ